MASTKKRRKPPAPGGKIWFIGGPLDNRIEDIRPWHATFSVAMPLGIPVGCCFGDEGLAEPAFESTYRLEHLNAGEHSGPLFFAYVHESVTHPELVRRVYGAAPPPASYGGFHIHAFEIDARLGAPKSAPARRNKGR